MLKAVFKGWLTIHVLGFIAMLAAFPFWWTLVFVFFRGAIFLDSGVSSMLPWLTILAAAALFGTGGYVAAANTRPHRVAAGFLLSAVMAAYALPLAFLTDNSGPEDVMNKFIKQGRHHVKEGSRHRCVSLQAVLADHVRGLPDRTPGFSRLHVLPVSGPVAGERGA
ncbi:MAG: hypothetical protein HQ546_02215 [Planctomycetes bacterium]|nr:hypothetical protein [Planctomycetota bacterium]